MSEKDEEFREAAFREAAKEQLKNELLRPFLRSTVKPGDFDGAEKWLLERVFWAHGPLGREAAEEVYKEWLIDQWMEQGEQGSRKQE